MVVPVFQSIRFTEQKLVLRRTGRIGQHMHPSNIHIHPTNVKNVNAANAKLTYCPKISIILQLQPIKQEDKPTQDRRFSGGS